MNKLLLFSLAVAILEADAFFQTEYVVTHERTEIEWIDNKTIIQPTSVTTFKFNRTTTAINTTLTVATDIDDSLMLLIESFKFLSNEYRELPSMSWQTNFCKMVRNNDYGYRESLKCGNFSGCPIKKGTYVLCNHKPDNSKFPPLVPFGRYKVKLTAIYKSKPILSYHVLFAIDYPIKWQ